MSPQSDQAARSARMPVCDIPDASEMRRLGCVVAGHVRGGDLIVLSGPLGAGKTTFAQGFGQGLGIGEPIVSPTFTIAREMRGEFRDGSAAHLVHVDAYRLGGIDYAPGQDTVDRLLDELESLGLDEELEDPDEHTVVLMEWGEQMAAVLAQERLQIHITRPPIADQDGAVPELTSDGVRRVSIEGVGTRWHGVAQTMQAEFHAHDQPEDGMQHTRQGRGGVQ